MRAVRSGVAPKTRWCWERTGEGARLAILRRWSAAIPYCAGRRRCRSWWRRWHMSEMARGRATDRRGAGAFAAQQIDLNQAQRIDIRVAQAHGSEEYGIRFQQFLLAGDGEDESDWCARIPGAAFRRRDRGGLRRLRDPHRGGRWRSRPWPWRFPRCELRLANSGKPRIISRRSSACPALRLAKRSMA